VLIRIFEIKNMEATDIIAQVQENLKNTVLIKWQGLTPPRSSDSLAEEWGVFMTNNPGEHLEQMKRKHMGRNTHQMKFEVPNIDEGLRICRDLFSHFGGSQEEIEFPSQVDTGKKIFVVVHILFLLN
jgi:hypothetical protein